MISKTEKSPTPKTPLSNLAASGEKEVEKPSVEDAYAGSGTTQSPTSTEYSAQKHTSSAAPPPPSTHKAAAKKTHEAGGPGLMHALAEVEGFLANPSGKAEAEVSFRTAKENVENQNHSFLEGSIKSRTPTESLAQKHTSSAAPPPPSTHKAAAKTTHEAGGSALMHALAEVEGFLANSSDKAEAEVSSHVAKENAENQKYSFLEGLKRKDTDGRK